MCSSLPSFPVHPLSFYYGKAGDSLASFFMWIWCNWKNGWNFQWVRVGSNIAYCSTNYTLNALCVQWSLSLPPLPLLPHWLGTCSKCSKVSCCSEPSLIPGNKAVLWPHTVMWESFYHFMHLPVFMAHISIHSQHPPKPTSVRFTGLFINQEGACLLQFDSQPPIKEDSATKFLEGSSEPTLLYHKQK